MALNNGSALLSCLVFVLSLSTFASMATSEQGAYYLVKVKTGDRKYAGTDSKISLLLTSASGDSFLVDNLKDWGIMGAGHNYFEQNNLDFFFSREIWLQVCAMTISSDGKGPAPGWYLDYVEVTTIHSNKATKIVFRVNNWLDPTDGYKLSATVNLCTRKTLQASSI